MQKILKNERGSVALFVLLSALFFLVVVTGVAVSFKNKEAQIDSQFEKIKLSYEKDAEQVYKEIIERKHIETLSNGIKVEVPIPEDFTESTEPGETSVETGLVVKDTNGNEYVWIPVLEYDSTKCDWGVDYSSARNKTDGSHAYYTALETALKNYTTKYKNVSCTDVWYGDQYSGRCGYWDGNEFVYYTNGNMTQAEYTALYHGMLKSVYENGGFYIGRYEMGIAVVDNVTDAGTNTRVALTEYTPSSVISGTTTNTAAAVSIGGMTAPLSKQNAVAYTYITQSQAEMLAEMLNYRGVTSSLMFGVQWDAVCVYLEHFGKIDSNATASQGAVFNSQYLNSNNFSKLWGNYKNATFVMNRGFYSTTYINTTDVTWNQYTGAPKDTSTSWLCTTGSSDQNRACNIYDFAGNLSEWTLERYRVGYSPCFSRGGALDYIYYALRRSDRYTYDSDCYTSARSSLYIGSRKN